MCLTEMAQPFSKAIQARREAEFAGGYSEVGRISTRSNEYLVFRVVD